MTHYEKRLEEDVTEIRQRVGAVSVKIETALKDAVHAVLKGERDLASRVMLGDKPINREIRAIDKLCHGFVAKHLPSAGHLRFVSSVLRLNVELERIGDYAVAVARETVQLTSEPSGPVAGDIELIADQAIRMFRQAMESYNDQNAELARGTKGMANQVESTYQKVFSDLVQEGEDGRRPIKDLFALLVIFNRLSRVADQAKNICEDTLFAVAGETKGEKVYRVLFFDERNDALSQLAVAYSRKAFPDSGAYSSAGWNPANRLSPALESHMGKRGLDPGKERPLALDFTPEELGSFHVIVGLGPGAADHLERIPFHTIFLEWDVTTMPPDLDTERAAAWLDENAPDLQHRIQELMWFLRGEEAS